MAATLKRRLHVLIRPSWWIRNYGTSKVLTAFINERLDAGEVPKLTGEHTMTLGGVTLWRANFPCAYGHVWNPNIEKLPERTTALRLREAELTVTETYEYRISLVIAKAKAGAQ